MTTISLKDFILTGDFGPVKIGMTKKQIIDCLDEPDEIAVSDSGLNVLFYNGFEFFYDAKNNDALYFIQNDNLDYYPESYSRKIKISKAAKFDTYYFTLKRMEYSRIKDGLLRDGIEFTEKEGEDYDRILFKSGIELFFRHEENYDQDAISLTGFSHSAAFNSK